ncbi:MAG: chromosomal replication initiator protein DnaA [candidate division Zixibacteria bacterium]|nr:chromosomal replication initiator protein DnaA [candidate division Zixibacteria bacterium]
MPSALKSNNSKLWEDCLRYVSLRIKKSSFHTWFKHSLGVLDENDKLTIMVPNRFVADWLADRYSELIDEAVREVNGSAVDFFFEIKEESDDDGQTKIEFLKKPAENPSNSNRDNFLNERYRFENFVVGGFNQFAHAAAMAVAEAPGKTNYNPLFIYGGTGLGKTHLAQAIGHFIYENYPQKKVMYATSERFTSDFITSISNGTIANFTSQYRTADVLLIDDIQFFSGKESTQEQFFHTFNDLHQSRKQIVLTSDRHPRETRGLEERLLSRFASGLVADLQPPDLETRVAILRRRTEREGTTLPEDVLYFIANNVTSNIRELEGCFTRLLAYSSLEKSSIDLDFATRILGKEIINPRREITIQKIQKITAEFFKIELSMMTAKKKTSEVAIARQAAMYLARKYTACSLKSIGDAFGGRDHSTVIHACDLIDSRIRSDFEFGEKIKNLSALLN